MYYYIMGWLAATCGSTGRRFNNVNDKWTASLTTHIVMINTVYILSQDVVSLSVCTCWGKTGWWPCCWIYDATPQHRCLCGLPCWRRFRQLLGRLGYQPTGCCCRPRGDCLLVVVLMPPSLQTGLNSENREVLCYTLSGRILCKQDEGLTRWHKIDRSHIFCRAS